MELLSDFKTTVEKAFDEIDSKWRSYDGLVICGTHQPVPEEIPYMLDRIEHARMTGRPFLGICFGHQMAAIEYARNVLKIKDATSQEFGKGTFVVVKRPSVHVGLHEGETYWNNYEVSITTVYPGNFITTQYHPEYQSSKDKPHPILVKFLKLCKDQR